MGLAVLYIPLFGVGIFFVLFSKQMEFMALHLGANYHCHLIVLVFGIVPCIVTVNAVCIYPYIIQRKDGYK
jgi:hypothetical protein